MDQSNLSFTFIISQLSFISVEPNVSSRPSNISYLLLQCCPLALGDPLNVNKAQKIHFLESY